MTLFPELKRRGHSRPFGKHQVVLL